MYRLFMNYNISLLESADNPDGGLFIVTTRQLITVLEESVVDVHGVVLQHAVLCMLHVHTINSSSRARAYTLNKIRA